MIPHLVYPAVKLFSYLVYSAAKLVSYLVYPAAKLVLHLVYPAEKNLVLHLYSGGEIPTNQSNCHGELGGCGPLSRFK